MTSAQGIHLQEILTTAHKDFEKGLNAYAYFKVGNHELSEDLVQQTFIKIWTYLVKGGEIEKMKAFLYHILNNLIIDEYRRKKAISLDVLIEKGFDPSVNDSKNTLNILDGKAALLLILRLPKKYKEVMIMRYVQNLSLKEISITTEQSKNSVAVQIHRGLGKLKLLYHP